LQVIELAMTYLNDALSQMKADFKSLLHNLDLKELQSLLKAARLAEHALLLARAQSLHKRLDVILHIEPLLNAEQVDVGDDVTNAKQWTVSETCKLLAAVKRVRYKDFERPEEEIIGNVLRAGGFGEGRSEKEVVGYVRQLEEYFGKANEEGLQRIALERRKMGSQLRREPVSGETRFMLGCRKSMCGMQQKFCA
jgi:hypothetical protein